jgi:hypothetical protein
MKHSWKRGIAVGVLAMLAGCASEDRLVSCSCAPSWGPGTVMARPRHLYRFPGQSDSVLWRKDLPDMGTLLVVLDHPDSSFGDSAQAQLRRLLQATTDSVYLAFTTSDSFGRTFEYPGPPPPFRYALDGAYYPWMDRMERGILWMEDSIGGAEIQASLAGRGLAVKGSRIDSVNIRFDWTAAGMYDDLAVRALSGADTSWWVIDSLPFGYYAPSLDITPLRRAPSGCHVRLLYLDRTRFPHAYVIPRDSTGTAICHSP